MAALAVELADELLSGLGVPLQAFFAFANLGFLRNAEISIAVKVKGLGDIGKHVTLVLLRIHLNAGLALALIQGVGTAFNHCGRFGELFGAGFGEVEFAHGFKAGKALANSPPKLAAAWRLRGGVAVDAGEGFLVWCAAAVAWCIRAVKAAQYLVEARLQRFAVFCFQVAFADPIDDRCDFTALRSAFTDGFFAALGRNEIIVRLLGAFVGDAARPLQLAIVLSVTPWLDGT